jgi:hypothetical protein
MGEYRLRTIPGKALERRVSLDLSQETVALRAEVTQRVVSNIELGDGAILSKIIPVATVLEFADHKELLLGYQATLLPEGSGHAIRVTVTLLLPVETLDDARAIGNELAVTAKTKYQAGIEEIKFGSLVLTLALDTADTYQLIDSFAAGDLDIYAMHSVEITYLNLVIWFSPFLSAGAAVAFMQPMALVVLIPVALGVLRAQLPEALTYRLTGASVVITKRDPSSGDSEDADSPQVDSEAKALR